MTQPDRILPVTLVALALYAIPAVVGSIRNPDTISPDLVSYLQNARMVAEGRYTASVSGYWAPLEGWMMAPMIRGGMDPLHAKRVTSVITGVLLVVGAGLFSRRLGPMHAWWRAGMLFSLSIFAAHWTIQSVTPDLLMAAILLFYFHLVTGPHVLQQRGRLFTCGILGGLAYLAKSYALPFFVIHFAVSIVLLTVQDRMANRTNDSNRRRVPAQILLGGLTGAAGLAIVAGPWIYALHAKYGQWTFSTAAAYNRDLVRPGRISTGDGLWPQPPSVPHSGLWDPEPGRISLWETPEQFPHSDWSIRDNLGHQIQLTLGNMKLSRYVISNVDLAGLSLCVLALSPFLFFMLTDRGKARLLLWMPMTALIYTSGYLMIISQDRYLEPVLIPICCFLTFTIAEHLLTVREEDAILSPTGGPLTVRRTWIALVALVAFFSSERAARAAVLILRPAETPYRTIARDLAASGVDGPIASTKTTALFIAYHLRQPFLRVPRSEDWNGAEAELGEHHARWFLVFSDAPSVFLKERPPSWKLASEVDGGPTIGLVRVYRP